jgi:hypothetical protein
MIRRNTADHSYPHWHWPEGSHSSHQPCHRVPHNPVSSVGLLWGTTRTPDLWGFCGAAAALRLRADAPSKNLEPMGRDDPAPLSAREEIGSDPDRRLRALASGGHVAALDAPIVQFGVWDFRLRGLPAGTCFGCSAAPVVGETSHGREVPGGWATDPAVVRRLERVS